MRVGNLENNTIFNIFKKHTASLNAGLKVNRYHAHGTWVEANSQYSLDKARVWYHVHCPERVKLFSSDYKIFATN